MGGSLPSTVNFAPISAHLAQILLNPILAILERFFRRGATPANGDEKDQTAKEKSHPADDQRHTHGTHIKNPKMGSLTWG
jgi:hypothetical protein